MVLAALTCMASASAQVRTFKTLYAFSDGADGGAPWDAPLISNGQVFGTTYNGGGAGSAQVGTVFQYDPLSGLETYYYIFNGLPFDGAYPMSGMTADPFGDFFGTTIQGGYGLKGTVYEITGGAESVVYSFSGADGESPESNLTIDADGNVYGVTGAGGANGAGTVFALSGGASFVEVYSFGNSKDDGIDPAANMCIFKAVLYGTTAEGGKNRWGTIFSVNPATKAEAILYDFRGGPNGGTPTGGLIPDNKGNLYGTASVGGSGNGNTGNGLLFRINIKSATLTVVHKFIGTDGSDPTGPLITDGAGNFYGTTFAGGTKGYGTVYQYDATTNVFTSLYSFTNETDGAYPYGGVTSDSSGNLYGTATRGGLYNWGTLFELTAAP
jgi:uncharacterized repeat protein (TIGR03803 family)